MTQLTAAEQFEASKKQVAALNERRTRLQGQRDTVLQQLAEARKEALGLFDTADLGELRALLVQQEQANAAALATLAAGVVDTEAVIGRIEFLLANPERLLELEAELDEAPTEAAESPAGAVAPGHEDI